MIRPLLVVIALFCSFLEHCETSVTYCSGMNKLTKKIVERSLIGPIFSSVNMQQQHKDQIDSRSLQINTIG